jgi:hypothetical protein
VSLVVKPMDLEEVGSDYLLKEGEEDGHAEE